MAERAILLTLSALREGYGTQLCLPVIVSVKFWFSATPASTNEDLCAQDRTV